MLERKSGIYQGKVFSLYFFNQSISYYTRKAHKKTNYSHNKIFGKILHFGTRVQYSVSIMEMKANDFIENLLGWTCIVIRGSV